MKYPQQETVPHLWEIGDLILDLYEVRPVTEGFGDKATQRQYHEGGFGRVYKVWHRGWQREVAVKVPRADAFINQNQKDAFTRECETWVNLGLHHHIAACHYVRELGGIPRIFSEYAPRGTLEEWIRSKKLYADDKGTALARILDFSIQFAWGLHYSHERGLIHQDVKPLNALIWDDDTLKVSDFGLAGGREKSGIATTANPMRSILVSSGSMTPSYCSPEQAAGLKLDRSTDIWSWAVSLLQMFQGEVIWQSGSAAAHALEYYLENGASAEHIPAMPHAVMKLLKVCFQHDPLNRPSTLHECAVILCDTFNNELGDIYKRVEPPLIKDTSDFLNNRALSLIDLGKAESAEIHLNKALELDKHHVAATFNRGLLHWREGKITDAELLLSLEELHRELPVDSKMESMLGWACMEIANFKQARSHFEKAVDLDRIHCDLDKVIALTHAAQGQNEQTFSGHTHSVASVAFSPDGKYAVSGSRDHTIRLWEVKTGDSLRILKKEEGGIYHTVAFSPNGNVILCAFVNSLGRWNFETGDLKIQNVSHPDIQEGLEFRAFSQDARFGLCCGAPWSFQLWDIEQGTCINVFEGHDDYINSMTFSPNGDLALTASSDCTVRLWDIKSGSCLRIFSGHTERVTSVAFSPCGCMALSSSRDRTIRLWDISTSAFIRTMHATGRGSSTVISPLGNIAICGNQLWDLRTGRCFRTYPDLGGANCISADGRLVLSAGGNNIYLRDISSVVENVHISPWEYSTPISADAAVARQAEHHSLLVKSYNALVTGDIAEALLIIARARSVSGFSKSPQALVYQRYAGARSKIKFICGAWLKAILTGHNSDVNAVVFSPNGKFALSGSDDKTIRVWNMSTLECERVLDGKTKAIVCLAISPDSRLALSGINDDGNLSEDVVKTIQLWDIEEGQLLRTDVGHYNRVNSVAFSPDGKLALSAGPGRGGELQLWKSLTGERLRSFDGQTRETVTALFSPDGLFAISAGSGDKELKYWDLRAGTCVYKFCDSSGIRAAAFFPDSLHVITACSENIKIWLISDGTCIQELDGHKYVDTIAISPDGQYIVSGGFNILKLWSVSGELLQTFEGHTDFVTSVQFSPDGRFILSGSRDHTIRLWELDWEYEYHPAHDPVLKGK